MCGIRNLRVWYGPLPEMLCMVHVKMTQMMYTVLFCLIAYVTIAKFTFICIWHFYIYHYITRTLVSTCSAILLQVLQEQKM